MTRSLRPDQRATPQQIANVRAALHADVDAACDAWHTIQHQAATMGRGYPSAGGGSSSNISDPTAAQALSEARNPGQDALEWLAAFTEAQAAIHNTADRARYLLPLPESAVERGRVNDVPVCVECNDPITGNVKRADNERPYHNGPAGHPWCYMNVKRRAS